MKENQQLSDKEQELIELSSFLDKSFIPQISLDCVVFGFDSEQGQLKVLLLKMKFIESWGLIGGYVGKQENLRDAAIRVLTERTGATNIELKQFKCFGEADRSDNSNQHPNVEWLAKRFITIGFYALVDYKKVIPRKGKLSLECTWKDIEDIPPLMLDHSYILQEALSSLRNSLMSQPIGYGLLPEKFTLNELQKLYEIILDKKLNRGNFYRKIMKYQILDKLDEVKSIGAHKSPFLYTFNKQKYDEAIASGLKDIW